MVQLSGKGNDSSSKTKSGSGSVTVECTWSWRARSISFFLSAWAGGILQILRSEWYCEWTVFFHPVRSQRAVSNPLRAESPSALCVRSSFYKLMFRSPQLSDKWLINSLSLYLKSLWILLKKLVSNFVMANYELLNGLASGLETVCNLIILHKKQL